MYVSIHPQTPYPNFCAPDNKLKIFKKPKISDFLLPKVFTPTCISLFSNNLLKKQENNFKRLRINLRDYRSIDPSSSPNYSTQYYKIRNKKSD